MRYIFILLILPALFSCESETIQSAFNFELTAEEYAEIKRIPDRAEARKEAAFNSFSERTQIANYLLEGPLKLDVGVQVLAIEAKNKLTIDAYLERFVDSEITEEAIQAFYDENKGDFLHADYHVSHLLIRLPGTESEQDVEVAFATAQELREKLEAGEDFAALVTAHSDDKSTIDQGGKLSPISTRNGDPAITEALASLEEEGISQPVRTRLGIQLFRLDAKEEQQIEYESVKDKIAYQLRQEIKEKELARLREIANKT